MYFEVPRLGRLPQAQIDSQVHYVGLMEGRARGNPWASGSRMEHKRPDQPQEDQHDRRAFPPDYFSLKTLVVLLCLTASLLILPLILPPLPPPPLLLLLLPIFILLVLVLLAFMPSDVRNIASSYL